MWVMMRPVHQSTEFIPLVHGTKADAISEPERDSVGKINVVGDQQGLTTLYLQDKALMWRPFLVVGQQTFNDTAAFYPAPRVDFVIACFH